MCFTCSISPETTTQQTVYFLCKFPHNGPSPSSVSHLSQGEIVSHFVTFFHPLCLWIVCLLWLFLIQRLRLTPESSLIRIQRWRSQGNGGTEKEGWFREVKEEKEAHGLPFIYQQTSLLASPSVYPHLPPPLKAYFSPSELSVYPSPPLPRW